MLPTGKIMGVLVCHQVVTGNEVYFFIYRDEFNLEGKILKSVGDDGLINQCEMKGKGKVDKVKQKEQCMGCKFLC